jgi:hypothetical protein
MTVEYLYPRAHTYLGEMDISSQREWSKKSVQQGRSPFGARSVLPVREHGKRARTPLAAFFNIPLIKRNFATPEVDSFSSC